MADILTTTKKLERLKISLVIILYHYFSFKRDAQVFVLFHPFPTFSRCLAINLLHSGQNRVCE